MQDADAADLTQIVLSTVASAVGRLDYDPRLGSFRGWLFTMVRRKLANFLRDRDCRSKVADAAVQCLVEAQATPDEGSSEWDAEYEQRLFDWAAGQVRSQVQEATWQAFWLTGVEGRPGKEVAVLLGMSLAAVRLAKSRVLARLKAVVRQAEDANEAGGGQPSEP